MTPNLRLCRNPGEEQGSVRLIEGEEESKSEARRGSFEEKRMSVWGQQGGRSLPACVWLWAGWWSNSQVRLRATMPRAWFWLGSICTESHPDFWIILTKTTSLNSPSSPVSVYQSVSNSLVIYNDTQLPLLLKQMTCSWHVCFTETNVNRVGPLDTMQIFHKMNFLWYSLSVHLWVCMTNQI